MSELIQQVSVSGQEDVLASNLRQEYEAQRVLYQAQSPIVQRFLEAQARQVAEAIERHMHQIHFTLPDRVVEADSRNGKSKTLVVPAGFREQMAGGLMERLTRADLLAAVNQRLAELEGSTDEAVQIGARLVRHAVATHMVYNLLPSGRQVTYQAETGDEIPSIPVSEGWEPESALMAKTDVVTVEAPEESGRGELLVPFTPYARRFYLPQWVAFDEHDNLLVNTVNEAEAYLESMQRFLSILHMAVGLAPYMVADEAYQQKRYGMLGQVVNQGRALARYQTQEIIFTIQQRASSNDLNRGLSLSLPYFDDQALEIKLHEFQVIPAGRVMFVPAFVVRASRMEQAKVAQDTRLSPSTRRHLLSELKILEQAFDSEGEESLSN